MSPVLKNVGGAAPTSPYVLYEAPDYQGFVIRFTVTFDLSNNLTGATAFRDAACQYKNVYLGLGADGTPNTSTTQFAVPSGTTNISKAQLNKVGLVTLNDAVALQITAGP